MAAGELLRSEEESEEDEESVVESRSRSFVGAVFSWFPLSEPSGESGRTAATSWSSSATKSRSASARPTLAAHRHRFFLASILWMRELRSTPSFKICRRWTRTGTVLAILSHVLPCLLSPSRIFHEPWSKNHPKPFPVCDRFLVRPAVQSYAQTKS